MTEENEPELPKLPPVLSFPVEKEKSAAPTTQQKMQSLRLSAALLHLHTAATDKGLPEQERVEAARALGMSLNTHFDLVLWALRVAGGARRP